MFNTTRLFAEMKLQPPKILASSYLGPLPIRRVKYIQVRYSKNYAYLLSSRRFDHSKPQTPEEEWADRSKWNRRTDSLWWSVLCKRDAITSKRVTRSYLARKFRHALVESLRKKGFKSDGFRLVEDGIPPLTGSMQVTPDTTALTLDFATVVGETDLVVEALMAPGAGEKARKGMQYMSRAKYLPSRK